MIGIEDIAALALAAPLYTAAVTIGITTVPTATRAIPTAFKTFVKVVYLPVTFSIRLLIPINAAPAAIKPTLIVLVA